MKHDQAVASILATLLDFTPHERLEVLATVCAAYCQTNQLTLPSWELVRASRGKPGKVSARNSAAAKMGPRLPRIKT